MIAERMHEAPPAGAALDQRVRIHAALADHSRLAILDELASSDRSPTDLQARLRIGSNLLAHHLGVLQRAGLVIRSGSTGDRRRKYLQLVPDTLMKVWGPAETFSAGRVLFICTANSARSQLAAAIWNARHDVPAESAGTRPAPRLHPEIARAAARAGLDLRGARPRSLGENEEEPDLTITVCDRALELLRLPPTRHHLHWSVPDPAESGAPTAFDETIERLSTLVDRLAPRVAMHRGTTSRSRRRRRNT